MSNKEIAQLHEIFVTNWQQMYLFNEEISFSLYNFKKIMSQFDRNITSFHTLPVELVYRILDKLDTLTILLSCRNVCTRFNAITDSYYRYQVNFSFTKKSDLGHL